MKEDRLKDFIQQNKSSFDSEKPPARVWDSIDSELGKQGQSNVYKYILGGVGILALFLGGLYIGSSLSKEKEVVQPINLQFAEETQSEFKEMDYYYGQLLEDKKSSNLQLVSNPVIVEEMENLNNSYEELKSDFFKSNTNDEELMMHLMIENYKLRIKLIELALNKTKKDSLNHETKIYKHELQEY